MLKFREKNGFSLIGIIVATFIALVGLVAILSLANTSLIGAATSKNRLIASGLTQEGIEIVRDIRASYADWTDWEWYSTTTPLFHSIGDSQEYCIDYNDTVLNGCAGIYPPLKLNVVGMSSIYQYNVGDDTIFSRKVTLTRKGLNEVKVEVEVKWTIKGQTHTLVAEDRLWNWK